VLFDFSREHSILKEFLVNSRTPDTVRWEFLSVSIGMRSYIYTVNLFSDPLGVLRGVEINACNTIKDIKRQLSLARREAEHLPITSQRKL